VPLNSIEQSASIPIVVSSDDGYAMQLAVAIRSLLDSLSHPHKVALYVLDGGISTSNKDLCEASWNNGLSSLHWIQPDAEIFADLQVNTRFTIASYYRILSAEFLPESLDRVVFTDPDVLFFGDVSEVFALDLHNNPIAAVQDAYCPFVYNRYGMKNYRQAWDFVFDQPAIPNLPRRSPVMRQPYFNAGFLVIDLARFRREQIGRTLLRYCHENRDRLIWADQCAMNACLGDRWQKIDPAWNVTPPVFGMPNHRVSCFDRETFDRIRSHPAMLHFAGSEKPWHFGSEHPYVAAYFEAMDRTKWKSWRPAPSSLVVPRKRKRSLPYRIRRWLMGG
jgi:lipopolysaccharide biosynthesis glycosyltransferase